VAGEDDLGALADEVLDGGDGGADAGVVGDVLVLVERHVEVGAHEDALPLEVGLREVPDALLGHGGHGAGPARGRRLAAPRRDVDREVGCAAADAIWIPEGGGGGGGRWNGVSIFFLVNTCAWESLQFE